MFVLMILLSIVIVSEQNGFDQQRIVGGETIPIQKAPYTVGVQYNKEYICAGAILSVKFVATAARCKKNETGYSVKAGATFLNKPGLLVKVVVFYTHIKYDSFRGSDDFGLLKLKGFLIFGPTMSYVHLPTYEIADDTKLFVTGWGQTTNNTANPSPLRGIVVPKISLKDCKKAYEGHPKIRVGSSMFCAAAKDGKSPCLGDAGAPVIEKGTNILYGLVSFCDDCGKSGLPIVFANLRQVKFWYIKLMGNKESKAEFLSGCLFLYLIQTYKCFYF